MIKNRRPTRIRKPKKRSRKDSKSLNFKSTSPSQMSAGTSKSSLCTICHERMIDGGFLHNKSAHVTYCYTCTKKICNVRSPKCPVCRQSVNRAIKLFFWNRKKVFEMLKSVWKDTPLLWKYKSRCWIVLARQSIISISQDVDELGYILFYFSNIIWLTYCYRFNFRVINHP